MSLADEAILATSPAFAAVHADEWLILGTGPLAGTRFQADAQTEAPLVVDSALGEDSREQTFLYIDRPAPAIERGMVLQGKGSQWRVNGNIDDNAANYRVKIQVSKIVNGKDSP